MALSDTEKNLCAWLMKSAQRYRESETSYRECRLYTQAQACASNASLLEEVAAVVETEAWKVK